MTTHEDIKPGDVVYLKSGSPPLTVDSIHEERCLVLRFNEAEVWSATLNLCVLTKVNPNQTRTFQERLNALLAENETLREQVAALTPGPWIRFGNTTPEQGKIVLMHTGDAGSVPWVQSIGEITLRTMPADYLWRPIPAGLLTPPETAVP